MSAAIHLFGIRHLSAGGATHLETLLEKVQPAAVVVEAPSGTESIACGVCHPEVRLPAALLCFPKDGDEAGLERSWTLPLARYSPEYVAIRWAAQRPDVHLEFCDLPPQLLESAGRRAADGVGLRDVATAAGEPDVEAWWEENFEHIPQQAAYQQALDALGAGLRAIDGDHTESEERMARDLNREAFMRQRLREVIAKNPQGPIVVVVGAYHLSAMKLENFDAKSDAARVAELKGPRADAFDMTLMPTSYERLHSRSGYGAGNSAPAYYALVYDCQRTGDCVPEQFLSRVAKCMREHGRDAPTSRVIDAVILAKSLAAVGARENITLRDLRESAIATLGHGESAAVEFALDVCETGYEVGFVPVSLCRTAFQKDYRQQLTALDLNDFISERPEEVVLDLRENRRVKNAFKATMGLRRSQFFRRLAICGIDLATNTTAEDAPSWREVWTLQWASEQEVRVAECSMWGNSVRSVATHFLGEKLATTESVGACAAIALSALEAGLAGLLTNAFDKVQRSAVEDTELLSLASALRAIVAIRDYGGLKSVNDARIDALLCQIFNYCVLAIPSAIVCNDDQAPEICQGLSAIHTVALARPELVDSVLWRGRLVRWIDSGTGHPRIRGMFVSMALQLGEIPNDALARIITFELSPAVECGVLASFVEGALSFNRSDILGRGVWWEALAGYVDNQDGDSFLRLLVPLRRAFSDLSVAEVRHCVGALHRVWHSHEGLSAVNAPALSAAEVDGLNEQLADLDLSL